MSLNLAPGPVINALGGVLLVILAALVLRVRPRRRPNVFLAAFLGGLGTWSAIWNILVRDDPLVVPLLGLAGAALTMGSLGVVKLSTRAPISLPRNQSSLLLLPIVVGALGVLVTAAGTAFGYKEWMALRHYPPGSLVPGLLADYGYCLFSSAVAGALVLLALRFGATADERERSQLALMSSSVVVYSGLAAGTFLTTPILWTLCLGAALALGIGCSAALWLRNTLQKAGRRQARDVALLSLVTVFAGMVVGVSLGGLNQAVGAGFYGVARTVAFALLAYAILRHQILGIDVKLKWTIRRGTVAASFLAVFLVVGQLAQNYFTQGLGLLAGGVAAGLMLFALSPLQRFAEKVADTALPNVKSAGEMSHPERSDTYRRMARAAWADGNLSRDERNLLDQLREQLELSRDEAARLESEASRAGV